MSAMWEIYMADLSHPGDGALDAVSTGEPQMDEDGEGSPNQMDELHAQLKQARKDNKKLQELQELSSQWVSELEGELARSRAMLETSKKEQTGSEEKVQALEVLLARKEEEIAQLQVQQDVPAGGGPAQGHAMEVQQLKQALEVERQARQNAEEQLTGSRGATPDDVASGHDLQSLETRISMEIERRLEVERQVETLEAQLEQHAQPPPEYEDLQLEIAQLEQVQKTLGQELARAKDHAQTAQAQTATLSEELILEREERSADQAKGAELEASLALARQEQEEDPGTREAVALARKLAEEQREARRSAEQRAADLEQKLLSLQQEMETRYEARIKLLEEQNSSLKREMASARADFEQLQERNEADGNSAGELGHQLQQLREAEARERRGREQAERRLREVEKQLSGHKEDGTRTRSTWGGRAAEDSRRYPSRPSGGPPAPHPEEDPSGGGEQPGKTIVDPPREYQKADPQRPETGRLAPTIRRGPKLDPQFIASENTPVQSIPEPLEEEPESNQQSMDPDRTEEDLDNDDPREPAPAEVDEPDRKQLSDSGEQPTQDMDDIPMDELAAGWQRGDGTDEASKQRLIVIGLVGFTVFAGILTGLIIWASG